MPVFKTIPLGYTYLNAKKPSATAQSLRKKRAQEHPMGKQTPNADTINYTKDVKYFDERSLEETRKGFNLDNLLLWAKCASFVP